MFRDEVVPWLNGQPNAGDEDDDDVIDLSALFGADDVDQGVTSGADLREEGGPVSGFVDTVRDNAGDHEIDASQYKREDIELPGQGNDDAGQGNRDDTGQSGGSGESNREDNGPANDSGQGNRDDNADSGFGGKKDEDQP